MASSWFCAVKSSLIFLILCYFLVCSRSNVLSSSRLSASETWSPGLALLLDRDFFATFLELILDFFDLGFFLFSPVLELALLFKLSSF